MRRFQIVVLGLVASILLAVFLPTSGAIPTASGANANVGFVDDPFGPLTQSDATADKPQSKLWFNDGSWWAVMFHPDAQTDPVDYDSSKPANTWLIYKLTWPDKWTPTSTVVDTRTTSRADALWDGRHLYIARWRLGQPGQVLRWQHHHKTYSSTPASPSPC